MRFFARANTATRTPSGFARFQATTRGTASQIVKSLEARGLVVRHSSETDGRSMRFDLTPAGKALLPRDPLGAMIGVIAQVDAAERARFLETLGDLAAALAGLQAVPAIGTCRGCTHFAPAGGGGHCACMAVDLAAEDIDRLCARHSRAGATAAEHGGCR